jgi:hypothetical protein
VLALFLALPDASPANGRLSVTVRDQSGAAIAGAYILVHWDPAGSTVGLQSNVGLKEDMTLRTDTNGAYSGEIPPGFYDVFVSSSAFTPYCEKLRVRPRETAIFSARLGVSPIVSKELD